MPFTPETIRDATHKIEKLAENIPPSLQPYESEINKIKEIAKNIENSDDAQAKEILDIYKAARTALKGNLEVGVGIGTLKNLLKNTHDIVEEASHPTETLVDLLWNIGRKVVYLVASYLKVDNWLSCLPELNDILDNCGKKLISINNEFESLLTRTKGAGKIPLNIEQGIVFRNEFRNNVLQQLITLCSEVRESFKKYVDHKITPEVTSDNADKANIIMDLTHAQRCLLSYIRVISSFAGIKRLKQQKAISPEHSSILQPKKSHGPDQVFGYGIVALMFESLYNSMVQRASNELKCDDGKDIWVSSKNR